MTSKCGTIGSMAFQKGHKLNLGNQYAKGKKHTDEWKQKARERMLGNTRGFVKGKSSPRKGKKATKLSHWKGKKLPYPVWNNGLKGYKAGEEHYNWVSDRTQLQRFSDDNLQRASSMHREWSKQVKIREKYQCKIANKDCMGKLESHHILNWRDHPELRYEINNGITLCHFHHPRKREEESKLAPIFQSIIDLNVLHLD